MCIWSSQLSVSWINCVVPIRKTLMWTQRQFFKILSRHFQTCQIGSCVQISLTTKARRCLSAGYVIDDSLITFKRSRSPIATYQIEHPMFNRIPLRGSSRVMGHCDIEFELISKVLQSDFEQATTITITATTITFNQQMSCKRILMLSDATPPPSYRTCLQLAY